MSDVRPKTAPGNLPAVTVLPWPVVAEKFQERVAAGWRGESMLKLVRFLAQSKAATHLSGAVLGETLLLADEPAMTLEGGVLHIAYAPAERLFHFFHQAYFGGNDRSSCNEAEVLERLQLFLEYKFGVSLVA